MTRYSHAWPRSSSRSRPRLLAVATAMLLLAAPAAARSSSAVAQGVDQEPGAGGDQHLTTPAALVEQNAARSGHGGEGD